MIYSKFKDYYDHVVFDTHFKWVRKSENILLEDTYLLDMLFTIKNRPFSDNFDDFYYDSFIFGFCGKVQILYVDNTNLSPNKTFAIKKVHTNIHKAIKDHKPHNSRKTKVPKKRLKKIKEAISLWNKKYNTEKTYNLFIKYKTPIFILRQDWKERTLILNPCLREYGIHTIYDPYTMYQNISMFLTNDLVSQEDILCNISDELKRDMHGFDNKSFKKHSHNRKNKL